MKVKFDCILFVPICLYHLLCITPSPSLYHPPHHTISLTMPPTSSCHLPHHATHLITPSPSPCHPPHHTISLTMPPTSSLHLPHHATHLIMLSPSPYHPPHHHLPHMPPTSPHHLPHHATHLITPSPSPYLHLYRVKSGLLYAYLDLLILCSPERVGLGIRRIKPSILSFLPAGEC